MEKVYTIGVLIGNANSPHTMDLMQEIHRSSQKLNVNVLYFLGIHTNYYYKSYFGEHSENNFDYQFNTVYDYAWLGKVDALIISYGSLCIFLEENNKEAFLKRFSGIPYVLLEEPDETHQGTSIIADNYNGMRRIVEHLVKEHHYREFTYLAGPRGNTDAAERKRALEDVLREHQIPFDESRIQYGDFSACVESQVNYLLDHFPQMDAMVCANDVMASTVYQECSKRGIRIGRDLAVTGYDDWEISKSMDPPLTTVLQNAYDMGYMAIIGALELCKGKRTHSVVVPAQIKLRCSCGCHAQPETAVVSEDITELFLSSILLSDSNSIIKDLVCSKIQGFFQIDFSVRQNQGKILELLKEFLDDPAARYISPYALSVCFCDYIGGLTASLALKEQAAREKVMNLMDIRQKLQHTIFAHTIYRNQQHMSSYQQETWFLPLISRDMMNHIDNDQEFYRAAMIKLPALRAKSSYLYVFDEPVIHHRNEVWKLPDHMYLAACHEGDHIISFQEKERPVLSRTQDIVSLYRGKQPFSMSIFALFSGEQQFGFLVTQIDPSNLALSYLISMQIGNALKFHALSQKQKKTQQDLEKLLEELHEKNELLNYISEYDTLTRCFNRRGLLEHATHLNRQHPGTNAFVLFADIDHLKEINDCFGHIEGDYAICYAAQLLQSVIREDGIVGRVGGDEFVAMVISKSSRQMEDIVQTIKNTAQTFNRQSDKPYYIELSIGYEAFLCGSEIASDLPALLEKADLALYEEKKKRRKSVAKAPSEMI